MRSVLGVGGMERGGGVEVVLENGFGFGVLVEGLGSAFLFLFPILIPMVLSMVSWISGCRRTVFDELEDAGEFDWAWGVGVERGLVVVVLLERTFVAA